MAKIRELVPIGLPISAIVLFVLGLLAGPVIRSTFSEEALAQNVLLNAIPFILIFVAIVLVYVILIWVSASLLNDRIPRRIHAPIESATIAGIVLGILGMFQPWVFAAYRYGFYLLLVSTLAYILWSHITPKGVRRGEELSVSVTESVTEGEHHGTA